MITVESHEQMHVTFWNIPKGRLLCRSLAPTSLITQSVEEDHCSVGSSVAERCEILKWTLHWAAYIPHTNRRYQLCQFGYSSRSVLHIDNETDKASIRRQPSFNATAKYGRIDVASTQRNYNPAKKRKCFNSLLISSNVESLKKLPCLQHILTLESVFLFIN